MYRVVFFFLLLILFLPTASMQEKGFIVEGIGKNTSIEGRKRLIDQVLSSDHMYFGYSALKIILDSNMIEPRGQMKGKEIRLSPRVPQESEFLKLLVHEVAHYVDIYSLISFGKKSDPSTRFYTISWKDKSTKKPGEGIASFVSGYAATNQYEDFAESFTFFIFHNEEFASRALRNESMRKKYLFFSENVFSDGTFLGTEFSSETIPSYLWDTTKIPISVKKYLYFLRSSI